MTDPSLMVRLTIPEANGGQRLDRALAAAAAETGLELSRSRLAALIAEGAVTGAGGPLSIKTKTAAGAVFDLRLPPPTDPVPQPEAIPLTILHEDADLIVVDKAAGMVVHPAPGSESGTLVNALLHHCGDSLAGIGGERRPGIVHRIDKDTSGVLVVAKTQVAHTRLSEMFAAHDLERLYTSLVWGAPERNDPRLGALDGTSFGRDGWLRIETEIGRDPRDRKKMAVLPKGGRRAITHLSTAERFGPPERSFAALVNCQLETGRTHQIRVHTAYIGHSLIGDPVYGRPRALPGSVDKVLATQLRDFPRQALHAARLAFAHPITGAEMDFDAHLPQDMNDLLSFLRQFSSLAR